jgi:hypothetical protein
VKPLFQEKQQFPQWLRVIVVGNAVIVIGTMAYGMYVQLIEKQPWGDKPMGDEMLVIISFFTISIMALVLFMFLNSELETLIDRSGLSYRYYPLLSKWRRLERESIKEYELKTWLLKNKGHRLNLFGNRTIIMRGNQGVKVHTHQGKWVLLGTQKPEEFMDALRRMNKRTED